ncbi:MAG: hypothetical protein LBP22_05850 [Deltaproteobacteria bacterium]|nr:hypothetical protein [Deltaproteobacteria bacterium]
MQRPAHNKSHDFVYEDDFKDPAARHKEVTGQAPVSCGSDNREILISVDGIEVRILCYLNDGVFDEAAK